MLFSASPRRTPWWAEELVGLHLAIESIDRENWNNMGSTICNKYTFSGRRSSAPLYQSPLGSVALARTGLSERQRSKTWYLGSSRGCSICNRLEKNIQLSAQASFVKGAMSSRALLTLAQLEHRKREAIWEPKVAGDTRRATNIESRIREAFVLHCRLGGPCRQG